MSEQSPPTKKSPNIDDVADEFLSSNELQTTTQGALTVTRTLEDPQVLAHRLRNENRDQWVQRGKDVARFVLVVAGIIAISYLLITIVGSPTATPEDKKWAQTGLSALLSGGIGYALGKQ